MKAGDYKCNIAYGISDCTFLPTNILTKALIILGVKPVAGDSFGQFSPSQVRDFSLRNASIARRGRGERCDTRKE